MNRSSREDYRYYKVYSVKASPQPDSNLSTIIPPTKPDKPTIKPENNIVTADIIKFEKLSISPKWLYVDGLNYGSKFFGRGGSHWSILEGVEKIKRFIKAATNSGWQLKVFIDAAAKSNEAMRKWRTRREAEVAKENREVPQAMNVLIGDAFQENGIEVLYSVEADNDDTLAAYASRDNAAILSGDRDFFRYRGLTCQIYGAFKVEKGYLHLIELIENDKYVSKRNLILPPPKVMDKDPSLVDLSSHIYRRGAPSALVKRLGNIHIDCRSLRQALYSRKGVKNPVLEIFPIWQDDRVGWLEEHVLPDDKLDHLLDNPIEALEALFPKATLVKPDEVPIKEWKNHLYAIHAVVYELCALANKNGISFLQLIRPAILQFKAESPSAKPAYETVCIVCKISIQLYERDVEFYQTQGFSMPKRCKGCKQAKQEKQEKNERRNKKYYSYY